MTHYFRIGLKMDRLLATFSVAVLLIAVGQIVANYSAPSGNEQRGKPITIGSLFVGSPQVNLGDLYVGDPHSFETTVRNTGLKSLSISDVTAGCSCTDVLVKDRNLEPGESTALVGTLRGKTRVGSFRHEILITASESTGREEQQSTLQRKRVVLVGNVKRRIRFSPDALVLRPDFTNGINDEGVVAIENTSQQTIEIRDRLSVLKGIDVALQLNRLNPGQQTVLKVRVDATHVTPVRTELEITCTHPSERRLSIPLHIEPVTAVHVAPTNVHLGVRRWDELATMSPVQLSLRSELFRSFRLHQVNAPPYLRVDRRSTASTDNCSFEVTVASQPQRSDLAGEIQVSFQEPNSKRTFSVQVPVFGFVVD